jgi:hypothetical protein
LPQAGLVAATAGKADNANKGLSEAAMSKTLVF